MTVFGVLADAAILSAGILSFWLLDRDVRPGLSGNPGPEGRHAAPATRADVPANDDIPIEDEAPSRPRPAEDPGHVAGAERISLGLVDLTRRPAGSAS